MVSSYQGKLQEPTRFEYPKAGEFMSRAFNTVKPDTNVYHAIDMLLEDGVSGLPVVDDLGKLVGFISEKDCLALTNREAYESNRQGGPVADFMTKDVMVIAEHTGLSEVAELFTKHPFRKFPVVRQDGKLIGLIRRRDVLAVIRSFYKQAMDYVQNNNGN